MTAEVITSQAHVVVDRTHEVVTCHPEVGKRIEGAK